MLDIFDRIERDSGGPIGQYFEQGFGYYMYPRLEGELGPHMTFNGMPVLNWSLNNYLGLANHPEVRKADAEAAAQWGLAYPMGARMMTGHTRYHEALERKFAEFEKKEDAFLYNFGYQGIVSTIDALTARHDVIVYDAECHACLLDGIRLHIGSKYKYRHNNMADCDKVLARACKEADENGGGVLLITEGVYGMTGALGKLDEIVAFSGCERYIDTPVKRYSSGMTVRLGFAVAAHLEPEILVVDEVLAVGDAEFQKKAIGKMQDVSRGEGIKRMEIIDSPEGDELRKKCWTITHAIQEGFKKEGFDIGEAQACVTPVHIKGGVAQATKMAKDLRENYRIFCSMVIYPVIPKGMVIFRIVSTAAHTMEDVNYTLNAFKEIKAKLDAGEYDGDDVAAMTVE